jgi:4-amino-4-deoxy-L-arabinose transferase-like glycosyltransferase
MHDPAHEFAHEHPFTQSLITFIEQSHTRACVILLLVSLACFLPGFFSLHPMDRDEPRFAQATRQMLETGDYVDIRFQTEARHKKPVGIYWLQAGAVKLGEAIGIPEARSAIWLYRLPSLFGALAAVLLTYWAALVFASRMQSFLAAAFMATSIIVIVESKLAKTDAMLLACSVATMGVLARAYLRRAGRVALSRLTLGLFWLAFALGILIKGPLIVMFVGFPAIILSIKERSARWLLTLKPLVGLAFTALVVAPWFIAIMTKSAGLFWQESVGKDMLGKIGAVQKQHWAPPGTYLVAFFATFWPAAILSAIAANFAWHFRREDAAAFALSWIIPSWLVFEMVPTKLPHYVMPLYPAIAIITVLALTRGWVGPHRWGAQLATLLIPAIPLIAGSGIGIAAWMLDSTILVSAIPFILLSVIAAFMAWQFFKANKPVTTSLLGCLSSLLFAIGVLGFAQKDIPALKLSPRMAEAVSHLPCGKPLTASLGYREPSLVFLVGTHLELLETPQQAAAFLQKRGCRALFVEKRFEDEMLKLSTSTKPVLLSRVGGFNINGGRLIDMGVYTVP